MSRSARASALGIAGFTLIEALAALAVATTGIAAIGSLSFSSLRSSIAVERHIALIGVSQKIVTGMPDRADLADGELTGVIDSYRWQVEARPFRAPAAPVGGGVWRPQLIALHVRAPNGSVFEIDTVRLRKRSSP